MLQLRTGNPASSQAHLLKMATEAGSNMLIPLR